MRVSKRESALIEVNGNACMHVFGTAGKCVITVIGRAATADGTALPRKRSVACQVDVGERVDPF